MKRRNRIGNFYHWIRSDHLHLQVPILIATEKKSDLFDFNLKYVYLENLCYVSIKKVGDKQLSNWTEITLPKKYRFALNELKQKIEYYRPEFPYPEKFKIR